MRNRIHACGALVLALTATALSPCQAGDLHGLSRRLIREGRVAGIRSVVVLPFLPADGYGAGEGEELAERFTAWLVAAKGFRVAGRAPQQEPPPGTDAAVIGVFTRDIDRYLVRMRLIELGSGRILSESTVRLARSRRGRGRFGKETVDDFIDYQWSITRDPAGPSKTRDILTAALQRASPWLARLP